MEQHQQAVNDPIATKLRDTAALEKVMQQAVLEAVKKARKLGFLKTPLCKKTRQNIRPPSANITRCIYGTMRTCIGASTYINTNPQSPCALQANMLPRGAWMLRVAFSFNPKVLDEHRRSYFSTRIQISFLLKKGIENGAL